MHVIVETVRYARDRRNC